MKLHNLLSISLVFSIFIMFIGCSGSSADQPLAPAQPLDRATETSHGIWGLYQFVCDPEAETIEVYR